jgi:hypothetical protein
MSQPKRTPAYADTRHAELKGDESVIPKGLYCYDVIGHIPATEDQPPRRQIKPCPYWGKDDAGHGYCAKLQASDGDPDGTMLLFDQVKECGINDEDIEDPDK